MTTLEHYDRAMQHCTHDLTRWRALNRAAAAIREGQPIYEPYRWRVLRCWPITRLTTKRQKARLLRLVRGDFR